MGGGLYPRVLYQQIYIYIELSTIYHTTPFQGDVSMRSDLQKSLLVWATHRFCILPVFPFPWQQLYLDPVWDVVLGSVLSLSKWQCQHGLEFMDSNRVQSMLKWWCVFPKLLGDTFLIIYAWPVVEHPHNCLFDRCSAPPKCFDICSCWLVVELKPPLEWNNWSQFMTQIVSKGGSEHVWNHQVQSIPGYASVCKYD